MAIAMPEPSLETSQTIEELPLAAVAPAADNPRKSLGDVDELAASMIELGVLQPLIVTPRQGSFMVVCGHRRYAAAKKANLATVPAIVRQLDEPQRIKAMLIENCQRADLAPLEEARAYRQLVELGLSQRAVAGDVGKAQSHVSKRLSLLEIPKPAAAALDSGGITVDEALELAKLRDDPKRMQQAWKTRGQRFGGLRQAVEEQIEARRGEQLLEGEEAKLAKKGIRTIRFKQTQYGYPELPANAIRIQKGGGYDALNLDPAKHAGEPCHAVAIRINRYGGAKAELVAELVTVCTDRNRHPKAKTGDENWRSRNGRQGESQQQKDARELAKAKGPRRAFAGVVARGRAGKGGLAKDERGDLLLDTLIRSAHSEVLKVACAMLDLKAGGGSVNGPGGNTYRDFGAALREHAAASAIKREQVENAIAFATHEEFMTGPWNGWDQHRSYVELLERHGYEITPIEAKKIGRKKTRKAAA